MSSSLRVSVESHMNTRYDLATQRTVMTYSVVALAAETLKPLLGLGETKQLEQGERFIVETAAVMALGIGEEVTLHNVIYIGERAWAYRVTR